MIGGNFETTIDCIVYANKCKIVDHTQDLDNVARDATIYNLWNENKKLECITLFFVWYTYTFFLEMIL